MHAIQLKEVVEAIYEKPTERMAVGDLVEVPEGTAYDAEKHIRQIFKYRDQIIALMKYAPAGPDGRPAGMDFEEMANSMDIIRKTKKAASILPLDNSLYDTLRNRVLATKWMSASEGAIQFVVDIKTNQEITDDRMEAILLSETVSAAPASEAPLAAAPTPNGHAKDRGHLSVV